MSTICKLDPEVRRQRTARANLLRNPPRPHKGMSAKGVSMHGVILAALSLIKAASRIDGATKHRLFTRAAIQLSQLR